MDSSQPQTPETAEPMESRAWTESRPDTLEFVVLTGMSGAGRSTAAHVMEDLDWYVVDNLPPQMLPELARVTLAQNEGPRRVVAVVDVRSGGFFDAFEVATTQIRELGVSPRVIFMDANDESLVRRFESVRRPHPLQGDGRLLDGIQQERRTLADLRAEADLIVDTSGYNVHQLSAKIREVAGGDTVARLRIAIVSFGFKYGVPLDADIVFDMRFLPNPFWVPALRPFTGKDQAVSEYVLGQPGAQEFLDGVLRLMQPMLDGYLREGRRYITVAVGCTGGKHRSVAVAEQLAQLLDGGEVAALLFHRDLGRE